MPISNTYLIALLATLASSQIGYCQTAKPTRTYSAQDLIQAIESGDRDAVDKIMKSLEAQKGHGKVVQEPEETRKKPRKDFVRSPLDHELEHLAKTENAASLRAFMNRISKLPPEERDRYKQLEKPLKEYETSLTQKAALRLEDRGWQLGQWSAYMAHCGDGSWEKFYSGIKASLNQEDLSHLESGFKRGQEYGTLVAQVVQTRNMTIDCAMIRKVNMEADSSPLDIKTLLKKKS